MAARTNKIRHDDDIRRKIKAGVIIQRLMKHIESDKPLMDASQVSAAKVLLAKCIADLKAIEVSGPDGGPIKTTSRVQIIAVTADDDDTED